MSRTRQRFTERMNVLLDRGPDVDDEFWDGLEEALILSDVGAITASEIVEEMREEATRKALPDAYAVMDTLTDRIADTFTQTEVNIFEEEQAVVLFVGINGAGKTTTVGKIAYEAKAKGRNVLLGCGDTFRAAAIEQLEEWGRRANVEIVERERGSDPASVCYETIERAEVLGSDLVLIDTAGRLHTSADLMRELQKVVGVVRKRSKMPVRTVLVIDATTGQNGLSQAREFNKALDLDALIVTKLDGTAKGGIALAVSHELELPIAKVGVGERLEDLQDFDARDFAAALIGAEPEDEFEESQREQEPESVAKQGQVEPEPVAEPAEAPVQEPVWPTSASPEVPLGPTCWSCGAPKREDDRFCMYCGAKQVQDDDEAHAVQEPVEEAQTEAAMQPGADLEVQPEAGVSIPFAVSADGEDEEDFSADADAAFEAYEAQRAEQADGSVEPEPESAVETEEEPQEEQGRIKRMFRWRGRK